MGKGLAIYLNEKVLVEDKTELWWAKDWEHEDVVHIKETFLAGPNHIFVYGLEGCCEGSQSLRV